MTKYTVFLVAMFLTSISAQASTSTASPDILASVSSGSVSVLTTQEMSETRGERVGIAGKILLCELINIPFCDLSYDLDLEIFSVAAPLPFGLGTVYLQQ